MLSNLYHQLKNTILYQLIHFGIYPKINSWTKLNLCSGPNKIKGYCNVDISSEADVCLDLERKLLPFKDETFTVTVCISAINYFNRRRGQEIINDVYRVTKMGGVVRFATQDLYDIANKYVKQDRAFFFQKLKNGNFRFEGETMADKINSWFYGYQTNGGKSCKYFYDYETLELLFKQAGFSKVSQKKYRESLISDINLIDNRPDQMFYLEAIK